MKTNEVIPALLKASPRSARQISLALGKSDGWASKAATETSNPNLGTVAGIAYAGGGALRVVDADGGQTRFAVVPDGLEDAQAPDAAEAPEAVCVSGTILAMLAATDKSGREVARELGHNVQWTSVVSRHRPSPRLGTVADVAQVAGLRVEVLGADGSLLGSVEPPCLARS